MLIRNLHRNLSLRLASERMDECLKKSAEARKYSISLSTLEYSGDLVQSLQKFSVKMEKVFRLLQDLVGRKIEDKDQYKKHFAIVDERLQWYEKAEAGLTGLYNILYVMDTVSRFVFKIQFYALRKTVVVSTPLQGGCERPSGRLQQEAKEKGKGEGCTYREERRN